MPMTTPLQFHPLAPNWPLLSSHLSNGVPESPFCDAEPHPQLLHRLHHLPHGPNSTAQIFLDQLNATVLGWSSCSICTVGQLFHSLVFDRSLRGVEESKQEGKQQGNDVPERRRREVEGEAGRGRHLAPTTEVVSLCGGFWIRVSGIGTTLFHVSVSVSQLCVVGTSLSHPVSSKQK